MNNTYNIIKNCKNCELCKNQEPLIQQSHFADIFWVGLSAVKISDKLDIPLSNNTNSGKLIGSIEFFLPNVKFHKTNLVKCLPLDNGKIRYPSKNEMKVCSSHLKDEISYLNPKIIFLLGKQVASFVLKEFKIKDFNLDDDFNYTSHSVGNNILIPIHHPSYILVYKRKKIQNYINNIERIINKININYNSNDKYLLNQNELVNILNKHSPINLKTPNRKPVFVN